MPAKRISLVALAVGIASACGTNSPSTEMPVAPTTTAATSRAVSIEAGSSTPAFVTPVEAVLAAAHSDQPELTEQNVTRMQLIYADQTLVDLRVELRTEGFCQWYGVQGIVEGSALQWYADRALPCDPTG